MRLPLISPANLTAEQRPLYEDMINLIGLYCAVSVTLNGFDVPIPDDVRS